MSKDQTIKSVIEQVLKEVNGSRKFKQSIDLIISLKDFNPKNPNDKVDEYVRLPVGGFKKISVCALVGKELYPNAKDNCDEVIQFDEFKNWSKARDAKKLGRKYDYFIAQANLMPEIAKVFGKYLGSIGKLPNPKMGTVVPANGDTAKVIENLKVMVKLKTKNQPNVHTIIGKEEMSAEDITKNAVTVIERIEHALPKGKQQIKHIFIKATMSKSYKVE